MPKYLDCPICDKGIEIEPSKSTKSGKYFIQLKCPVDARHFRGFIHDKAFVNAVILHYGAPADPQGK